MAAVTKGSGKYFYDFERVWKETLDTGVVPFWVGKAADLLKLPVQPDPQVIQSLCEGRGYLPHVQANRVGCFDLTISMSKSVSLLAYGLTPPNEWKGWTETFAKIATPEVEKLLANQRINFGRPGAEQGREPGPGGRVSGTARDTRGSPSGHAHYADPKRVGLGRRQDRLGRQRQGALREPGRA